MFPGTVAHRRCSCPGDQSLARHSQPSPPVGTKSGCLSNKARKRAPPSSTRLLLSEGCSLHGNSFRWLFRAPEVRGENKVRVSASWVLCIQVFRPLFPSQRTKWETVVESMAPEENREDTCGKGWSFSWKNSQDCFDQQLQIFQERKFSAEECPPNSTF